MNTEKVQQHFIFRQQQHDLLIADYALGHPHLQTVDGNLEILTAAQFIR